MTTAMKVFSAAGLPALPSATALAESLRKINTGAGGGMLFLRFDKTGHWIFGTDETEVEADSKWAVNPYSFQHGWIAWGEGSVEGEVMAPLNQPLPDPGAPPAKAERGWQLQLSVQLRCMDGEDEGVEAVYATTSTGGKKAVQALGFAIADQCEKDISKPVPLVLLKKDSYAHKKYGKVLTPLIDVVGWMPVTLAAEADDADDDVVQEPEPAAAPARRQRRAG